MLEQDKQSAAEESTGNVALAPHNDGNETDSDPEDLYSAWPPLRLIGFEPRRPKHLLSLIPLDEDHLQLVHRLMGTDAASQWRVTVMMMACLIQYTGLPEMGAAAMLPANTPQYVFLSAIKGFLQTKIHELLTTGNVHAYSRTQSVGGMPLSNTPLVLLMAHLEEQSGDFKAEHLPTDWPQNHVASQSVLALMRVLLKHKQGSLRNLVSTIPS
ncbi:hypothetical protein PCASD_06923 [Puccinia coronata f. sp. avenae]|uniref:Uncharacterized protein n=2 Tax=Puccinia coronata f. sp. avenae TaxID=200324 RepID=A0A2N5V4X1_9BASI|nr:hypothetical protein PCASD_06923 [Puccinia coronata f. sp. avenae]